MTAPAAKKDDLRGINRLVIDGIVGIVDLVEAMHGNIASLPGLTAHSRPERTRGITGFVYRTIRGTVGLTGNAIDVLLNGLEPVLGAGSRWNGRGAVLAALNGVLGDYLAASGNPLAVGMTLRRHAEDGGQSVELPLDDRDSLARAIPQATGKLLVLVHGLCMSDAGWKRKGHDHGAALARDLGYTPVYLHYNSGLHVSTNGQAFADRLERLVAHWPVPLAELVIIGHSMGGLVARSACRYGEIAQHAWRRRLDKLVFLGTPHHGSPLERGGNWVGLILGVSRYSAPMARLGNIRSAGITDLRYGNTLDEDWNSGGRFRNAGDRRAPLPLPQGVACFSIAAVTDREGGLGGHLLGDGLVPLASALGRHDDPKRALAFDESRQRVFYGTGHLDLLSRAAVCTQIRQWLGEPTVPRRARRPRKPAPAGSG